MQKSVLITGCSSGIGLDSALEHPVIKTDFCITLPVRISVDLRVVVNYIRHTSSCLCVRLLQE
ncbi:hypothetical protein, partial [Salmonella enterica]|uniref:hypothetical protein n=1 Tax=Salmonella enterica TaxID=28901 RepID=UPI002AFF07B1